MTRMSKVAAATFGVRRLDAAFRLNQGDGTTTFDGRIRRRNVRDVLRTFL